MGVPKIFSIMAGLATAQPNVVHIRGGRVEVEFSPFDAFMLQKKKKRCRETLSETTFLIVRMKRGGIKVS